MNKKELRAHIRLLKKQHTTEELSALSHQLTATLLDRIKAYDEQCTQYNEHFQLLRKLNGACHPIQVILLYHSLPDEVDTHDLIRTLHSMGKMVLLPTVVGDELELHEYLDENAFSTSLSFGIQESTGPLFTGYAKIDLAIIPGMAFTPQGDRLGRGKGYYDRLLPHLTCPLIGLAFPFQMVDSIPTEDHDVKMDEVIYYPYSV